MIASKPKKRERRATVAERQKLSPPLLAKLWGIDALKVITFIRSGELRAINVASGPGKQPRYLIDKADIAEFERRRAVTPPPSATRSRRKASAGVVEFF